MEQFSRFEQAFQSCHTKVYSMFSCQSTKS